MLVPHATAHYWTKLQHFVLVLNPGYLWFCKKYMSQRQDKSDSVLSAWWRWLIIPFWQCCIWLQVSWSPTLDHTKASGWWKASSLEDSIQCYTSVIFIYWHVYTKMLQAVAHANNYLLCWIHLDLFLFLYPYFKQKLFSKSFPKWKCKAFI